MSNIQTIFVVLHLPISTVSGLIARVNAILSAMAENAKIFPAPTPALAVAGSHVTALVAADSALKTHAGTRADRDAQRKLVIEDAHQLHAYVQGLANANPAQADSIAQAASMSLRKTGSRNKSDLAIKQTVSGTVQLVAKSLKGARSHEWQYSVDGGKTWVSVDPTAQAKATVTGLQPAVATVFRHRIVLKAGPSAWSQPVTHVVS
jgi:hypothetical protein